MFHIEKARQVLQNFQFGNLFVEELGWNQPGFTRSYTLEEQNIPYTFRPIAELSGVMAFEVTAVNGSIPDGKVREALQRQIAARHHENLLIFLDGDRRQTVWFWVKRDGSKRFPRTHTYVAGQSGDLLLSKIAAMFVDMGELDEEGNLPVVEAARRVQVALDIERVTKRFYDAFKLAHDQFLESISGIADENDRRWYTSVVLNRLMFIYFLQKKGFIDRGNQEYLQKKLSACQVQGSDRYYTTFLKLLFFEGFAKPPEQRSPDMQWLLGEVRYLNGGLFLPHPVEDKWPGINIPDVAFERLYEIFGRYSWNLDDRPGGQDDEISPDVLGYIFEKYINQKAFGAYYTRPEITEYLCEQTIHKLILDKVAELNRPIPGLPAPPHFDSVGELLLKLDATRCQQLIDERTGILSQLSLLDPACGSGAFLVAAMKTMLEVYRGVMGRIPFLKHKGLQEWLAQIDRDHPSRDYYIKKRIITDNLFGVDIMAEAVEIARLRLFLALVSSATTADQLEPLPNIDFNILPGNSLIGLLRIDETAYQRYYQPQLFSGPFKSYRGLVQEKSAKIQQYRHAADRPDLRHNAEAVKALRDEIDRHRRESGAILDRLLLEEFQRLGIKFEQATWDSRKNQEGKPIKRPLTLADIHELHPFHWGYEFDEVMNERGGFDAIITNPPWEIFKPIDKEFSYEFDPEIERRGTNIKEFNERFLKLLENMKIKEAYLRYLSQFPHVSAYFRASQQYTCQITVVDGQKTGSDINLYKLFVEQSFNLLRKQGVCGIVIPSGIYSDLGATGLRQLLFTKTEIKGLFGFENRKKIFEGVHSRFKFVVLTFSKGGQTTDFPATFMRHEVADLLGFPMEGSIQISVDLVQRTSPGSMSIMEFTHPMDAQIAQKMLQFPNLGEQLPNTWNLVFTNDFHMTNDSHLFKTTHTKGDLALYEGKMIWHFGHGLQPVRYWVSEKDVIEKVRSARSKRIKALLREAQLPEQFDPQTILLDHHNYRLGFRAVTGATNERALVVSIIPKSVVAGNSLILSVPISDEIVNNTWAQRKTYSVQELLVFTSLLSSFVCDWFIRQKILTNMNMFYVYQMPVPRLTKKDIAFFPIMERAAKLICTTPEFDELAAEVGLGSYASGVTDAVGRAKLRAELDGFIAHVYGLTEAEFAHILSTFPLVALEVKEAALAEYRRLAPNPELLALIAGGENAQVEFKAGAFRNPYNGRPDNNMRNQVVWALAAFLNSPAGGTVLLGVKDDGEVIGVQDEYLLADARQPTRDKYELALRNMVRDGIGAQFTTFYDILFHQLEGKEVCQLKIRPATQPAYAAGELYVRDGNSKKRLTAQESKAYIGQLWGA